MLFEPNQCYGNPGRFDHPCQEVLAGTGRRGIIALLLMVLFADSRGIPLTTVLRWAGRPCVCSGSPLVHWKWAELQAPPRNVLGHAHVSYVIPGWDGARYISHVFGWCTSL